MSTTRPPATSTVGTIACTNGTSASSAPSRRTTRQLAARAVDHPADHPDDGAVHQLGAQAFELVDVELVGVVGRR